MKDIAMILICILTTVVMRFVFDAPYWACFLGSLVMMAWLDLRTQR